jgi:hypothetical protein
VTLTELEWTHPVHGIVTESLCSRHEPLARNKLAEFGIKYTTLPASDQQCHRCHEALRWHNRITPHIRRPT